MEQFLNLIFVFHPEIKLTTVTFKRHSKGVLLFVPSTAYTVVFYVYIRQMNGNIFSNKMLSEFCWCWTRIYKMVNRVWVEKRNSANRERAAAAPAVFASVCSFCQLPSPPRPIRNPKPYY